MNDHHKTFIAFVKLGTFLTNFCNSNTVDEEWSQKLNEAITLAGHQNGWFTKENIHFALKNWGELLTEENITEWLSNYNLEKNYPKSVALIMAGNIPLVGFHDFLVTLITGNTVLVKLSSNDKVLLPFLANFLINAEPELVKKIQFTENKLENFDAVIATGSNNTARYFDYYFSKKPHIIRRNRNSIAVLTGNETNKELSKLGEDIFQYYGLGCRSVSKLFVPKNYDFTLFFEAIYPKNSIISQTKYANNYDYNKAVYLMSEFKILDNGFLILKEDKSYASPIASIFYEYYDSIDILKKNLSQQTEKIQCIVAQEMFDAEVPFGHTQKPSLSDYADGVDTVDFLLKTNKEVI